MVVHLIKETTLAGKMILKNNQSAKTLGYEVHLYYLGLGNVETALERIEKKVNEGGHLYKVLRASCIFFEICRLNHLEFPVKQPDSDGNIDKLQNPFLRSRLLSSF